MSRLKDKLIAQFGDMFPGYRLTNADDGGLKLLKVGAIVTEDSGTEDEWIATVYNMGELFLLMEYNRQIVNERGEEMTADGELEQQFRAWFESGEEDMSSRRAAREATEIALAWHQRKLEAEVAKVKLGIRQQLGSLLPQNYAKAKPDIEKGIKSVIESIDRQLKENNPNE